LQPADAARAHACTAQGIETVRRDNCLLVRQVVETCLQKILVARDVPGAVAYVKATIADLLMNRMDLSLLVITKGLTQEVEEYDNKAAHVELARKMKARDAATAPAVGDRIPYVIVKAAKGVKAYEKSEGTPSSRWRTTCASTASTTWSTIWPSRCCASSSPF
jgi:DNA polymerase delta subunit 1